MMGGIEKMSKSKNNGIDPQALIDRYGADTARLFTMFASPPEQTLEWSESGVEGAFRFLRRLWNFAQSIQPSLLVQMPIKASDAAPLMASLQEPGGKDLRRDMHSLLKQASYDMQRQQYNTVVSASMKMLNSLEEAAKHPGSRDMQQALTEGLSILLRTLYPVVPHLGWTLWRELGFEQHHGEILNATWPEVDDSALVRDSIELVLQINGKVRGSVAVPASADAASIEAAALATDAFIKFAEGKPPKKIVVVPGRLVNIVV
jgi:leucyl-tRNA synthetase